VTSQVGCGTGNTVFPLLAEYPDIFVHACDFSARAVNLVKVCNEHPIFVNPDATLNTAYTVGEKLV